jgi:hypothetical protein
VDDIIHFNLQRSIFDLVVISTVKVILLVILVTELETVVINCLYRPIICRSFINKKNILLIFLILIVIGSLTFSIIKLIIVVHNLSLSKLNLSAVCIFVAASSLESIGILLIYFYLKKLKLIEQRLVDSKNEEKINLRRIFSLVQSERSWLSIGFFFLLISSFIETVDLFLFGKILGLASEQESMHSINITIAIVLSLDLVSSIATFIYSWVFALAGQ